MTVKGQLHACRDSLMAGMRAAWEAQQQVSAVRAELLRASGNSASTDVIAAMASLSASIDSAVGPAVASSAGSGAGSGAGSASRATFRSVSGALASQLSAQDNADLAPSVAMRAAYAGVCRDLSAVHSRWQRVLQVGLPAANAVLARSGVALVESPSAEGAPMC